MIRLPYEDRWDEDAVMTMSGTPESPVPGGKSDHIPIEVNPDNVMYW